MRESIGRDAGPQEQLNVAAEQAERIETQASAASTTLEYLGAAAIGGGVAGATVAEVRTPHAPPGAEQGIDIDGWGFAGGAIIGIAALKGAKIAAPHVRPHLQPHIENLRARLPWNKHSPDNPQQ
jgi:hypothetical protein